MMRQTVLFARLLTLAAVVLTTLAVPGVAYADSDGYYCTGRGYLAYQFGMAPKPIAPHRVYVISTRGPQGIPEPAVLEMPQFQVHGMVCGDGWIDIASFTTIYRITLDKNVRPVTYEERGSRQGQPIPQAFIQGQFQNLGPLGGARAYVKSIRTSLGVKPSGGDYVLEITAKAADPVKACEISVTSRIVETDAAGQEVSARILFQGRGYRECSGGAEQGDARLNPASGSAAAPLSETLRSHVKSDRFDIVTSIRGLPLGVRSGLQTLFGSVDLDIAEPGARFQTTGAAAGPPLPMRRLVAAACSTDHCLIHYERGGTGHTWHVALFHWTPSATRFEWGGVAPGRLATLDDIRAAIMAGAIKASKDW